MSTLKTNTISTNDANNVALSNQLNLKSYTTTARDALTSVAGDMIYNTTVGNPQVYDGSSWDDLKAGIDGFQIEYLVVGGGGAGAYRYDTQREAGAGGAGGYRNSTVGEATGFPLTNPEQMFIASKSTTYSITVGAGGTAGISSATSGEDSKFGDIVGAGGGRGSSAFSGSAGGVSTSDKNQVGSGGGGQKGSYGSNNYGGGGSYGQGGAGGNTGGGGGANADGSGATAGAGKSSSITGSSVTYAAGGTPSNNTAGTVNTGEGGGSSSSNGNGGSSGNGSAGGSGVVILRWVTADATIGATRTGLTDGGVQTDGSDSYIVFTAGTGNITFS